MHRASRSPQGKNIVSWEVSEELIFSRRRAFTKIPTPTPIFIFTPINPYFLAFSRTPQAYGLQESTSVLNDNDLSPCPTIGIPAFRTRVLYVPQRPSLLPGTPRDFLHSVSELKSHREYRNEKPDKGVPHKVLRKAKEISGRWGVEEVLWEREWSNLSGGEAQRIALAVALALDTAEILLLDGKFGNSELCSVMFEQCLYQSQPRH